MESELASQQEKDLLSISRSAGCTPSISSRHTTKVRGYADRAIGIECLPTMPT